MSNPFAEGNQPFYTDTDKALWYKTAAILYDAFGGGGGGGGGGFIPIFYPMITGLTGGGSTNLDGIATAGGASVTSRVVQFVYNGALVSYQLRASTAATALPGIVRPVDYDASSNPQVWYQIA